MKKLILLTLLLNALVVVQAQEEETEEKRGFKKEKLFTGGSLSIGYFNSQFQVGVNPVFGYSLTRWIDAGILVNYTYVSQSEYSFTVDKLRQSVYGAGVFARIFPVKFLFLQGQFEHNWIRQKVIYFSGSSDVFKEDANSLLVGGGYTSGREPGGGFFYFAVLVDVMNDEFSPYIDRSNGGRKKVPILRAGVQVPLFQGGRAK